MEITIFNRQINYEWAIFNGKLYTFTRPGHLPDSSHKDKDAKLKQTFEKVSKAGRVGFHQHNPPTGECKIRPDAFYTLGVS